MNNDEKNARLVQEAVEQKCAFLQPDPLLAQRVLSTANAKGEMKVKRKMSVGFVLALALAMMTAVTALAAGLGVNLFEYFGRTSQNRPDQSAQWAELAEQSVLATEAPVFIAHEMLGEAEAVISNAYYDGWQVIVAFSILNDMKIDYWTPTEEQRAKLVPDPRPEPRELVTDDFVGESQTAIRQEILAAVEAGQPVGFSIRIFYTGEVTANGVPLLYRGGDRAIQDIGARYEIMEYITPLRDDVRNQDELELCIPLAQAVAFYWFDGDSWLMHYEPPQDAGAMTATVCRSGEAEWAKRYEGITTRSDGIRVGVEAYIEDDGTLKIMMTADEPGLPFQWETESFGDYYASHVVKPWSIAGLFDENGEPLRCFSSGQGEYGDDYFGAFPMESLLGYSRLYQFEGDSPEAIRVDLDGWESDGEAVSILLTPVE